MHANVRARFFFSFFLQCPFFVCKDAHILPIERTTPIAWGEYNTEQSWLVSGCRRKRLNNLLEYAPLLDFTSWDEHLPWVVLQGNLQTPSLYA